MRPHNTTPHYPTRTPPVSVPPPQDIIIPPRAYSHNPCSPTPLLLSIPTLFPLIIRIYINKTGFHTVPLISSPLLSNSQNTTTSTSPFAIWLFNLPTVHQLLPPRTSLLSFLTLRTYLLLPNLLSPVSRPPPPALLPRAPCQSLPKQTSHQTEKKRDTIAGCATKVSIGTYPLSLHLRRHHSSPVF